MPANISNTTVLILVFLPELSKVKHLFKLRSQKSSISCVIYDCTGKRLHDGERKSNAGTR